MTLPYAARMTAKRKTAAAETSGRPPSLARKKTMRGIFYLFMPSHDRRLPQMPGISYSMEPAMGEKHDCYEILLNYNCNARCSFCSQGSFDKSANAKFPDVAKEIYLGKKKGYARLGLSGGEPLLRKDLCKIISVGRAVGFRFIRLQTNGILLADKGLCRAWAAWGLTFCKFTFASHKAAVHDALIGRPGA